MQNVGNNNGNQISRETGERYVHIHYMPMK